MHQLLNTLYVMTENTYLHLDHETLKVSVEKEHKLQVPLHHLGGVVCFGDVMLSPALMRRCGEDGRSLGADGQAKRGVFHIAAGIHRARTPQERGPH